MAYPDGITSRIVTGKFQELVYNKVTDAYTAVPKQGFVQITPNQKFIRVVASGTVYELDDLVNTFYKLDENGEFNADLIITNQAGIEPNTGWSYTIKFSWNSQVVTFVPVAGAGSQSITALVVPSA